MSESVPADIPVATTPADELISTLKAAQASLSQIETDAEFCQQSEEALICFDTLAPIIASNDVAIKELLEDTRKELLDAFLSIGLGRTGMAFVMLRGVMEGLFTALYYKHQAISLNLWANGKSFEMVHKLIESKHEFRMYYGNLFEDERFKKDYPGISKTKVFDEAADLYDQLSSYVHKKSASSKSQFSKNFFNELARVFRITITFMEREEDIPKLPFPSPNSFPKLLLDQQAISKKRA